MRTVPLVLTLVAVPALAQQDPAPEAAERPVVYERRTVIDVTDAADIRALPDAPGITLGLEPARGRFAPLVRLRTDFQRELRESLVTAR